MKRDRMLNKTYKTISCGCRVYEESGDRRTVFQYHWKLYRKKKNKIYYLGFVVQDFGEQKTKN